MARPRGGYRTADGARVPGVTTILSRFKEASGLVHWAWQCGIDGVDYREARDSAATAGNLAHDLVERWIIDGSEPSDDPGSQDPDVWERAVSAFRAFREWADQTQLRVTHTEVSLVSETHRFGGTLDAMLIRDRLSLGDWKSSNGIYPEYLVQLGAYALLWEEAHPDMPIEGGYHLLRFDRTYGDFHHHFWAELETAKRQFLLLREAYENDRELRARAK